MLIGLAATLVGLLVATALRQKACVEAGGRWLVERRCEIAGGAEPGMVRSYALGALAGVLAALMLWRTFTFFAGRGRPRG